MSKLARSHQQLHRSVVLAEGLIFDGNAELALRYREAWLGTTNILCSWAQMATPYLAHLGNCTGIDFAPMVAGKCRNDLCALTVALGGMEIK